MLETVDDNGFDLDNPAVLHYRIRAGEAEISRGATALPETLPFGEQFFWTGEIDLTDMGATTLLPSYVVDIWVSGSDASGNPFETETTILLNHLLLGLFHSSVRVSRSITLKQIFHGAIQVLHQIRLLNSK